MDKKKSSSSIRKNRSRSRSRSQSRPRKPDFARVHSARHFDDYSIYNEDDRPKGAREEDADGESVAPSTNTTLNEKEEHEEEEEHEAQEEAANEEVLDVVPVEKDLEKGPPLTKESSRQSKKRKDPNLVTWDGDEDLENPKNWSPRKRWAATFVVSSFTFISPVSSSMVAPSLSAISQELGITSEVVSALVLSIFVLAYAVGPLFLGPLSEVYGRVPVLQLGNLFFLIWNLACGFAQTPAQMIVFRFLAGLGGSAPLSIGGGVLSDCWRSEERGKAIAIYSLAPLLGPAVAPLAGGFITENTTWRWSFWAVTIAAVLVQAFGLFYLRETYPPKLLKQKAARLRKESGNERLYTEHDSNDSLLQKLSTAIKRPFIMLGTQPIIQMIALFMAYIYGLYYLLLSTYPRLWTNVYHESVGIGGLNYISLGLGLFFATQISARLNDRIYVRLKKKNGGVGQPEMRIPLMIPASFLIPVSLFWYGWSAQAHVHWIMPNIGMFLFGGSIIPCFQTMQTYIVDAYPRYAASGVAATVVLRSLAGFGFPLFAPTMYNALGYGWGNSVLAFVAIVIGLPAPFLFWKYGQSLREKSQFAAG